MEVPHYDLNDIVEMKKEHPCHKSKHWRIIRMGADIRIKCLGCGIQCADAARQVRKKLKKVVEHAPQARAGAGIIERQFAKNCFFFWPFFCLF